MLKSLHLTAMLSAGLILFIAEKAFSGSLNTDSQYSVVSSSDTDKLICYMQTADSRILDLNNLCRNKPDEQFQCEQFQSEQSQIVISEVICDGARLSGHVTNKSNKTVNFVKVNYEVFSQNGTVTESGGIYTEPQILNPGQSATFQTLVPSSSNVRTTFVEWNE